MSKRLYRVLQSSIGLGLAVYLAEKLASGKIAYYINLRFTIFTLLGIIGLLAMVISVLWPFFEDRPAPQASPIVKRKGLFIGATLAPVISAFLGLSVPTLVVIFTFIVFFYTARVYFLSKSEPEEDAASFQLPTGGLLILSVPLMLGLLVPVKPLSAMSLETRGMGLTAPTSIGQQTYEQMEITPDERNILDWVKIFNYEKDLSSYLGSTADVIGFVYHDPRLEGDRFMVGRFIITCCVADAFAVGMAVDSPESGFHEENDWVRVKGVVDVITIQDRKVPLIRAESITPISMPDLPYLYP